MHSTIYIQFKTAERGELGFCRRTVSANLVSTTTDNLDRHHKQSGSQLHTEILHIYLLSEHYAIQQQCPEKKSTNQRHHPLRSFTKALTKHLHATVSRKAYNKYTCAGATTTTTTYQTKNTYMCNHVLIFC